MKRKSRRSDEDTMQVDPRMYEIRALDEIVPDWRDIVGAVDTRERAPDMENPYRKWLASKDAGYQGLLNNTDSAAVIWYSIRLYQEETKQSAAVH